MSNDSPSTPSAPDSGEQPSIADLFADERTDAGIVLQYPSQDFPAPPAIRLRVPDTWLAVPVPDAVLAVRDPAAVDGFHPNVLVRVRRAAARDTVVEDLLRTATLDDAPNGLEVVAEEVRADLATPARWLLVRFRGPDGRGMLARHLLVYVPVSEHVASIVSVVGTIPASAAAELGPQMDRIVGSLRLAAAAPPDASA